VYVHVELQKCCHNLQSNILGRTQNYIVFGGLILFQSNNGFVV